MLIAQHLRLSVLASLLFFFVSCSSKQATPEQSQVTKTSEKITFAFAYTDSLIAGIIDTLNIPKAPNYLVFSKATCRDCVEKILDACTTADKEVCVIMLGAPFEEVLKNNAIYTRRSKLRFAFTHPALYDTLEKRDKRMAYNLLYALKRKTDGSTISYNNMRNIYSTELKPDSVIKFLFTP